MENSVFQDENIARSYFKLSIPLVLSLTVTLIYNIADTFFVAQTGDTNIIAGVSLGAPVFTLLMAQAISDAISAVIAVALYQAMLRQYFQVLPEGQTS